VRELGELDEVTQLAAHDVAAAERAAQGRLIDDSPHPRRVGDGKDLLPLEPQADSPFDLLLRRGPVAEHGDGTRIVRCLEQAGHELQLVGPDKGCCLFESDVCDEPVGHYVVVPGPPTPAVGVLRERQQVRALALVSNAIEGEQVSDVSLLEADRPCSTRLILDRDARIS